MGTVISFPAAAHAGTASRSVVARSEPATVIILPVIRIERFTDQPTDGCEPATSSGARRRRRRRASRS
jgi:hypothetical protein